MLDIVWASTLFERSGFQVKESRAAALAPESLAARIATLASSDPALFLERYGGVLSKSELAHFDRLASDYEVRWHLRALRQTHDERAQQVRNRRFRALAELESDGDFFSDHNMQLRAPQLYYQHVGRFLPSEERVFEDESLADRLLANYDADKAESARRVAEEAERLERQEDEEEEEEEDEEQEEVEEREAASRMAVARATAGAAHTCHQSSRPPEVDEANDDDDDDDFQARAFRFLEEERRNPQGHGSRSGAGGAGSGRALDAATARDADDEDDGECKDARAAARSSERSSEGPAKRRASAADLQSQQQAREELVRIMRERFLAGDEHRHYDYGARCDNNPDFDDHVQQARDAEERWFDED